MISPQMQFCARCDRMLMFSFHPSLCAECVEPERKRLFDHLVACERRLDRGYNCDREAFSKALASFNAFMTEQFTIPTFHYFA